MRAWRVACQAHSDAKVLGLLGSFDVIFDPTTGCDNGKSSGNSSVKIFPCSPKN